MRFCSLASGSDGNCHYIEGTGTAVLVDMGISCKAAMASMTEKGLNPCVPEALLLTHEHSDHVGGVRVWTKRFATKVYATAGTWEGMGKEAEFIPEELRHVVKPGEPFELGNLRITPIPVCHDAADPVGYVVEAEGKKAAVVTDTGVMTPEILEALKETNLAVVESNYDLYMLRHGPYPKELQRRVEGCLGHLSNEACGKALAVLYKENPNRICLLGHLSENNNTPECAAKTVKEILTEELGYVPEGVKLTHRGRPTDVYEI